MEVGGDFGKGSWNMAVEVRQTALEMRDRAGDFHRQTSDESAPHRHLSGESSHRQISGRAGSKGSIVWGGRNGSKISASLVSDGATYAVMHSSFAESSTETEDSSNDAIEDPPPCFWTALSNCTISMLGSGTLAVPCVMSYGGAVFYELSVFGIFAIILITVRWLIHVADALPVGMPWNYESIARTYLGGGPAAIISLALVIGCFSLSMASFLIIKGAFAPLLAEACIAPLSTLEPLVMVGIGLFVVLPLSLMRDIARLKTSSTFAVCSLGFVVCYTVFIAFVHDYEHKIEAFTPSSRMFEGLAMTSSAFAIQLSLLPIYRSLGTQRTSGTMLTLVLVAMVIAALFYHAIGYAGFAIFGHEAGGSILNNLQGHEALSKWTLTPVANVAVALSLICKIPIIMWAIRSCVLSSYRVYVSKGHLSEAPSKVEWYLSTTFLILAVLAAAYGFPRISSICAIGGSIGAALIIFIFPSVFHLVVVKNVTRGSWRSRSNLPELSMIFLGVVLGGICLSISVRNAIHAQGPAEVFDPYSKCTGTQRL